MNVGWLSTGRLGRRATAFMVAALLIGVPAAALRLLCAGDSCESTAEASPDTPFCSLPEDVRRSVTESVRDGRSGELLAVTTRPSIAGATAFAGSSMIPTWPSLESRDDTQVPVVVSGTGIVAGTELGSGTGLDDVAPTISEVLDFDRPHPEVRSGRALDEALASGPAPRLVVMIAWKGVGSRGLSAEPDAWPNLARLMANGAGTLEAHNNSWSGDPAPALTSLGTGGLPSQHGITGSLLRNEDGDLVDAWGPESPTHVIATLADDLDESLGQKPVIALVGDDQIDKGLVGGDWFSDSDTDLVSLSRTASPAQITAEAEQLLRLTPLARDDVPDVLAVSQRGPVAELDEQLGRLLAAVRDTAGGEVLVVVAGTGAVGSVDGDLFRHDRFLNGIERAVPGRKDVIEAVGPGEIFLDEEVLADRGTSEDAVLKAMLKARSSGEAVFADAFPSVTVTFGRFC